MVKMKAEQQQKMCIWKLVASAPAFDDDINRPCLGQTFSSTTLITMDNQGLFSGAAKVVSNAQCVRPEHDQNVG